MSNAPGASEASEVTKYECEASVRVLRLYLGYECEASVRIGRL